MVDVGFWLVERCLLLVWWLAMIGIYIFTSHRPHKKKNKASCIPGLHLLPPNKRSVIFVGTRKHPTQEISPFAPRAPGTVKPKDCIPLIEAATKLLGILKFSQPAHRNGGSSQDLDTWLITMEIVFVPIDLGLWDPFQMGFPWFVNGGDPNYLLTGMILQVGTKTANQHWLVAEKNMMSTYPPWNWQQTPLKIGKIPKGNVIDSKHQCLRAKMLV